MSAATPLGAQRSEAVAGPGVDAISLGAHEMEVLVAGVGVGAPGEPVPATTESVPDGVTFSTTSL